MREVGDGSEGHQLSAFNSTRSDIIGVSIDQLAVNP